MRDVTKLVPRTPPDGMLDWAAFREKDLDKDLLLIETVWAEDTSLEVMLDEWAERKKVRAIRATCSACTESGLLWRGLDGYGEWGFVHPGTWDGDMGGTICVDGDETTCPFCGARVTVRKKADVKRKGWAVAGAAACMSAAVVGRDKLLALTCWHIQRRISAEARRELVAIPVEAYVFGPGGDAAKLMGWQKGYSGTAGYYIQYARAWRQPKEWRENWGNVSTVYGLTPELVAGSCLPHCKMDEYMAERFPARAKNPVAYLRLYQTHPNTESLLLHGLPLVLDELLEEKIGARDWADKNRRGEAVLPEISWTERRPAQMLGLTKEELAMARRMGWGALFWRLFTRAKAAGEPITEQDITNAFCLGDERVLDLVGRGPVGKSLRYLLKQIELYEPEPEDEDLAPDGVVDVSILLDYWSMAEQVGRDLSDPGVRWPKDLLEAHDRMTDAVKQLQERLQAEQFRIRRRVLAKYTFRWGGLLIRPAASQRELVAEGDALHHCVGSYAKRHAAGETAIFFIRRSRAPGAPWYTLELDEEKLEVRQDRGLRNCARTPEVEAFEAVWLAWVRAGTPRDSCGRPMIQDQGKKKEVHAA